MSRPVVGQRRGSVVEIGETFFAVDRAAWRSWLQEHHADGDVIWLVLLKKGVPEPSVSYEEAVEEALCFGWIDGQVRRIDDRSHAIRFTPRRAGSVWSASNRRRVERLTAEGRMTDAGSAVVRAARERGDWDQVPSDEQLDVVPDDLTRALAGEREATEGFEALPPSARRNYVHWIVSAKREATRERRIAEVVRRSRLGLRPGAPG